MELPVYTTVCSRAVMAILIVQVSVDKDVGKQKSQMKGFKRGGVHCGGWAIRRDRRTSWDRLELLDIMNMDSDVY